jgi:hypothetical protein
MSKNVNKVFEREDERMNGMRELLSDYLDTVTNEELPEAYNVKKWAASELIQFLAYYVGDTHYEMMGILDECKSDLRMRHKEMLFSETTDEDEGDF